jgi:hypothetical protein
MRSARGRGAEGLASLVVLALVAALGLAVSGCGSSTLDPVAKAAETSTAATGFRMNFNLQISSPALPGPIIATGNGRFDRPARAGALTLDIDLGSIPQVRQVLGTSRLRLRELISGTTVYVGLPAALAKRIPGASASRPWLKIDLAQASSSAGVPGVGSLLNNPTSTDPSQLLNFLRATSGGVTKVGSASINGVPTTEYQAQVNLDKVPNGLPSAQRAQASQAIAAIERMTGLHQIPITVWVDGANLVRRMKVSFTERLATGQSLTIGVVADVLQYGPQPPPVLPAASQVTDLTGKLSGSGGGGTGGSGGSGTGGAGGGGYFPGG